MTTHAHRADPSMTPDCPRCGEAEYLTNVQETERVSRYGILGRDHDGLLVFDDEVVTAEVYLDNYLECEQCGWQDRGSDWAERL
ncbi:hypothetical protein [Phycicoccus jejuensis]|uniref:hypothetical protein n=1 Tax=Phycicoccus jejuensis TaxID=367299 RepID=UPI0004C440D0|nr:hypothetical protein [Phycicoccus jejuensis]